MIKEFKKGFSLVELLVVIAIIGILAAVGITAYSGYTADAKVKASTSQHAQVVALLNAEMARCASGKGDFVWATNGGDECNAAIRGSSIVTYFGLAGPAPLRNPYKDDEASVSLRIGPLNEATELSASNAATYLGRIALFCGDVATVPVCMVNTFSGEMDPEANLTKTIKVY